MAPGFKYRPALEAAGIVLNDKALLRNPPQSQHDNPGDAVSFPPLKGPRDIYIVIVCISQYCCDGGKDLDT